MFYDNSLLLQNAYLKVRESIVLNFLLIKFIKLNRTDFVKGSFMNQLHLVLSKAHLGPKLSFNFDQQLPLFGLHTALLIQASCY